ncbi:MAG: nodulation protein NfeD [Bacteroidetes bacterium SW_9_63_38]|nr:MAG: nodulation protein NfeD [Bacteroidetes bacterium SW_9_63_38]
MDLLDPVLVTWAFVIGGGLLMVLETVVPGGVAGFLGLGGLVVAGLRTLGLLLNPWTALTTWIFLSVGLTIALRPLAMRFVEGDISLALTDEDAEAMGTEVPVLETVGEESPGRIRFRGSGWDARSVKGTLPKGATARLLYRDNLTWVVEAADDSDLDYELDAATEGELPPGRTPESDDDGDESGGLGYDPSARVG